MPTDPATRQIWFINAAHFVCHYMLLILATAVLGMVAANGAVFGTEYGPVLALGTGMFVLYGIGALPMGWLAEKVGRHALMAAFFLGVGGSLLLAGFVSGPWGLAAALGLAGLFNAIYHPIGTAMLVEAAGDRVGRAMGNNGVFGNLGVASAPVVTALLVTQAGWRWAFLVPATAALVLGLMWLREPPYDARQHIKNARPFPQIPPAVVRQAVISLMLMAVASGFVFNAFTLLIPKLMQERMADSPSLLPLVGALAFTATLFGGLTQFTVGRMIDRTTLKRVFLPLALALVPALLALSFLRGWAVLPVAAIAAAAVFGQVTVNETMTARYVAPALRAKLYSLRFFVGFLGAAAASPAIGYLHDAFGNLGLTLMVLSAFACITLACALLFPDRPEELNPALWTGSAATPAVAAE
ncbi:MFS transporter [Pararoseomonas sp. SCSIO 73927]|uniref:MFS transporter n=1 Tax=Pararoseomonas sp. SCSIO 73927 TaxID=3114537 RepID=UPI0030D004DE